MSSDLLQVMRTSRDAGESESHIKSVSALLHTSILIQMDRYRLWLMNSQEEKYHTRVGLP
jgi:hypothetical protein